MRAGYALVDITLCNLSASQRHLLHLAESMMNEFLQAYPQSIHHSSGNASDSGQRHLLVFFITGNPGLIEYYRTFLTLCFDHTKDAKLALHVLGTSLAGFDGGDAPQSTYSKLDGIQPYDLQQQIAYIEGALGAAHAAITKDHRPRSAVRVILVGHSVGSYVLLETLRRHKERMRQSEGQQSLPKIVGGICLFPTVTHISESPSGRKISVRL